MCLVMGTVAGYLASRKKERKNYQQMTIELEKLFLQLKENSERIAEIEDRLRTSERLSVMC